jgi:hypothetical protein
MRTPFGLAVLSLLAACHGNADSPARTGTDASVLAAADFEQSIGWGDADPASLTTEKAHSGRWSVRVKPDVAFGYTYARLLGDLSPKPLTDLRLEGWVLREAAGSTAKLVVQVSASATDDTKVLYTAFPVAEAAPQVGVWAPIAVALRLPSSATGTNRIKVYLWNDQGTAATYLDDVVLRKTN